MVRFVSIVSRIEQFLSMINWQEVRYTVGTGLRVFIAGVILTAVYTLEGVQSFYRWAQPRLASVLQHPAQSVKNGPVALYNESLLAVMMNQATIAERFIVSVGATIILAVDTISGIIADSATLKLAMMGRNLILTWGRVNYTLVAIDSGTVYIMGQRMV